jgi:hypothetical protein
MNRTRNSLRSEPRSLPSFAVLAIEIGIYALLVTIYLLVALRALRPLLLDAAEHHRVLYAILALLLMLGQGALLEVLTTLFVRVFARARRGEGLATLGSAE